MWLVPPVVGVFRDAFCHHTQWIEDHTVIRNWRLADIGYRVPNGFEIVANLAEEINIKGGREAVVFHTRSISAPSAQIGRDNPITQGGRAIVQGHNIGRVRGMVG